MKIEKVKGGRRTPIRVLLKKIKKILGSGRKYNYLTRNCKANNFVVTCDSWKCFWKKLHDL